MSAVQSWAGQESTAHPYELLDYNPGLTPEQIVSRRKNWLNASLEEGYSWMKESREVQDLPKQIAYLLGDQWTVRRPSYKASPVNNRLFRSMEETIAILTDIRPIFEVKSHDEVFTEQAELMTKIVRAWWLKNDVDFRLAMGLVYAYLGTGFLRTVWNPRLADGRGDFEVQALNPYEVMPIGPTHDLQSWEGCIYESVKTVAWFRRNFPVDGWKVKPSGTLARYAKPLQRPRHLGQISFDMLSPQMQRWVGSPREFGESVVSQAWYREFWIRDWSLNTSENIVKMGDPRTNWCYDVRPGQLLYPRGRLMITGGDDLSVMYDGPNFFWHGKWPFVALRLKPVPWQFHGISELRAKMPLQDIVNTILAGTLDMIKKALNPPLLFPDNAFSDGVKRALDPSMPNAKIGFSPLAPSAPKYGDPPVLPNYVQNTLQYVQNEMDDDSGLLDLGGISRKKVTPAGDTLDALKEGQQTIMRLRGRYIEIATRDLGEQMVPNFFQFYTLDRRMWMFGPMGITYQDVFDANTKSLVPAGRDAQNHARIFSFEIPAGSLLKVNRTEDQLLAMALRRQGDMDRRSLFQMLDLEKLYDQVEKGLLEEQQQQMDLAAVLGLGGPPPGGGKNPTSGKGSQNPGNLLRQG